MFAVMYKNGNCVVFGFNLSFKVNNYVFANIQFSRVLSDVLLRGKQIMQFLVFLSGLKVKLSSFC